MSHVGRRSTKITNDDNKQHTDDSPINYVDNDCAPTNSSSNIISLLQQPTYNNQTNRTTTTTVNPADEFYSYGPTGMDIYDNNPNNNNNQNSRSRIASHERINNKKPNGGYIKIIAKIILQSPLKKLKLRDIYSELQKSYDFFKESKGKWQNSVRHCLSSNDCFVNEKVNCHSEGKGGYWSVDLKNLPDLSIDCDNTSDNRRRRRLRARSSESYYTVPREHILKNLNELNDVTLLVYFPDSHTIDFYPSYIRDIFGFVQRKYNMNHISYNDEFIRKLFREFFNIVISQGPEGYEQANILSNQMFERFNQYHTEFNNQMYYNSMENERINNNHHFYNKPMAGVFDYGMCDFNTQPFVNGLPNSFKNPNYPTQHSSLYTNNDYSKSMPTYNKFMNDNPQMPLNYNIYDGEQPVVNPPNFDPNCYNEEYIRNICSSTNQGTPNSNRNSQMQFYTTDSYIPTEFNPTSVPHPNVVVETSSQCNDVVMNPKIFSSYERENFNSTKENISNNFQNPLIVPSNDIKNSGYTSNVFNFPQLSNIQTTPSHINPIQSCYNTNSVNKHGS